MVLITWNCQGAYRKKASVILEFKPDILVVQECEHLEKLVYNADIPQPADFLWFGDNMHKGIGIFSYSHYKFQIDNLYNESFKFVVPIIVTGGQASFTMFAIWANNPQDTDGQYVEQVWKAINYYENIISNGPVILIGDFNSNTIWDKKKRIGNHSTLVAKLAEKRILSVYHQYFGQSQGKEMHPTFFLYRNIEKPYHIDYCFVSNEFYQKLLKMEIGTHENWKIYSDHIPLIFNFEM